MAMNDPLGDMLTRIRNAQMRRKGKVQTPGSRLRAHVLDVLQSEGYIRGYSTTEYGNGRTEFEIELKYADGAPVIREIRIRKELRTDWELRSFRPRRASWPTMPRATPMSVAKSSARSSNRKNEEILACRGSEKSRLSSPPG